MNHGLHVLHRVPELPNALAQGTFVLAAVGATWCYVALPLLDAVPHKLAIVFGRIGAVFIVLFELYLMISRGLDPAGFYALNRVLSWKVADAHGREHEYFSSYALQRSVSTMLTILACKVAFLSWRAPLNAVTVRTRVPMRELHPLVADVGTVNLGGRIFGFHWGTMLERFSCSHVRKQIAVCAFFTATHTLTYEIPDTPSELIATNNGLYAVVLAVFFVTTLLCVRPAVALQLLRNSYVWYVVLIFTARSVVSGVIRGQQRDWSWWGQLGAGAILMDALALLDSLPPALQRPLGRWGAPAFFVHSLVYWIEWRVRVKDIYDRYWVPEITVEGFVTLSLYECYSDWTFLFGLISLQVAYGTWRHPHSANFLRRYPTREELHDLWLASLEKETGLRRGAQVHHPIRGLGTVVEIKSDDARNKPVCVRFDNGEFHHYSKESAISKLSTLDSFSPDNLPDTDMLTSPLSPLRSGRGRGELPMPAVLPDGLASTPRPERSRRIRSELSSPEVLPDIRHLDGPDDGA
jgi:hypothetical protein